MIELSAEDLRDVADLDRASRELQQLALDEALHPMARIRLWRALLDLREERSAILGLDRPL